MLVLWVPEQVHGHVLDDGHIVSAETGSQAREVVVEDDIEDPMQPAFDAPLRTYRAGEGPCTVLGG